MAVCRTLSSPSRYHYLPGNAVRVQPRGTVLRYSLASNYECIYQLGNCIHYYQTRRQSSESLQHLEFINKEMDKLEDTLEEANDKVTGFTADLDEAKGCFPQGRRRPNAARLRQRFRCSREAQRE